jgi:transcriptional regulator with GAF, ATPase, and Fis domain
LIKVNCAALTDESAESELFGHEKGAFAGAIQQRIGLLELANGGTILLDEVGRTPLEVQARLSRVLQERQFEPMGGTQAIKLNVRVVASTSLDLRRAVREKAFREDLYQRLHVFPIHVPPLRDRREDIPLLAEFLTKRFAARVGKTISGISPSTMEGLQSYAWPGNVRELENILERAVILSPGPVLEISPEILASPAPTPGSEPLELAALERIHIRAVLERTRWIIDGPHGAAKLLGLHPNTLRSRLKRLGLQRPGHGPS